MVIEMSDELEGMKELAIVFTAQARVVFNDLDRLVQGLGLSAPMAELIWHLAPNVDPPAMKDLALAMNCDRSNVTGLVDRLVRLGLAERTEDPSDRRSKTIRLTAAGAKTRQELLSSFGGASVFSGLSPAAVRQLTQLLRQIGPQSGESPVG
jgi:DNA-binding MarR family transcriptional regulator